MDALLKEMDSQGSAFTETVGIHLVFYTGGGGGGGGGGASLDPPPRPDINLSVIYVSSKIIAGNFVQITQEAI